MTIQQGSEHRVTAAVEAAFRLSLTVHHMYGRSSPQQVTQQQAWPSGWTPPLFLAHRSAFTGMERSQYATFGRDGPGSATALYEASASRRGMPTGPVV